MKDFSVIERIAVIVALALSIIGALIYFDIIIL